ncbi:MAG TPA: hypothetical protein VFP55_12940 [Solirubrobacteraceae bacterium]|nr:hypothetical protein [Solirubrobacteraceae bacterium]
MLTSVRELDSRTSSGIRVQMLWCPETGRVFVTVNDRRTGDAFSLEVPEHERASEMFEHPFAYAS